MSKFYRLLDLLDINDDYLNRRGIAYTPPVVPIAPQSTIEAEEEFILTKNEDKKGVKKIKKFEVKVERDNKDDSIPAPNPFMPNIPFAIYLLGVVKAGKTTLLDNLINVYIDAFDEIVFISPTHDLDPEQIRIIEKYDIKKVSNSLTMVNKVMTEAINVNKNKRPKDKIKTLIIMDDVINSIIKYCKKEDNFLNRLATNRRHLGISFILLSQYYKRCPPLLRTNFSSFALFRQENMAERRKIIEELGGFLGKKRFEELFDEATREPFSFLSINYDAPERKYQYTKNYNTMIMKEEDTKMEFKKEN